MAEEEAVSLISIAKSQRLPAKEFEKQYKEHISGFRQWNQLKHADRYILFPENIGRHLSIDEVSLSNGELYTVITNKAAKGRSGAIVVMVQGTKADEISPILRKIDLKLRLKVKEITLDMAGSMELIVTEVFPNADKVTDRFHVQKVVSEAAQEIRIDIRKRIIKEENDRIKWHRKQNIKFRPFTYKNGDTKKQLLARSRHLLFKASGKWTDNQKKRAEILFREYPEIRKAYELSMMLRSVYEYNYTPEDAKKDLDKWYKKVEEKNIDSFISASETIRLHEATILNYFNNRSTNASAESFNAKLKGFRAIVRGVRDVKFHLFRIAKLYG
ncbi:transposase [Patescibacteria group bacterium]|nr:transposase [Patescibacteria group bacterium]